jgi:hypothetical protein
MGGLNKRFEKKQTRQDQTHPGPSFVVLAGDQGAHPVQKIGKFFLHGALQRCGGSS